MIQITNGIFVGGETLRRCPRCEENLPLSDFGVCRARPDGLNLYCKLCIRQKIAIGRMNLRAYQKARGKLIKLDNKTRLSGRRIARVMRKLSPADRVREAIRYGAHTQKEIAHITKLAVDEVCDALASLLLWKREIRTQVVRHQRMYFICEAQPVVLPARKENVMSFSAVSALMPGRKSGVRGLESGVRKARAA